MLKVTHHTVRLKSWIPDRKVLIAVLADFHVCDPWVSLAKLRRIVQQTNELKPDLIYLGGDFIASRKLPARSIDPKGIAEELARLSAPLGVFSVLGNHDWNDDPQDNPDRGNTPLIESALEVFDIAVLRNENRCISYSGDSFWLVGTDSQSAKNPAGTKGRHDLKKASVGLPASAPRILLAHEPDIFVHPDNDYELTLSGHTHAGQLNLFGWWPLTPSAYGGRYAYGHIQENGRSLIVSAGIGYSGLPMRIGSPSEITLVTVEKRHTL